MTAGAGVTLDLWTKWVAFQKLAIQVVTLPNGQVRAFSESAYQVIPGWLEFEVTANRGAVFGLGQGLRVLFILASLGAVLFLIYLFTLSEKKWGYQIILGMLLAGVLGNLYDRVRFGYVRDMIHALPRWPYLFPWIFNVADSLLCVGVGLMVLHSLFFPGPLKVDYSGESSRNASDGKRS
ncbi:MAG: signal peptidase II [Tepidisphaeraceae bacterium]